MINVNGYTDIKNNKLLFQKVIKNHGVIEYPTDTLNGIGCSVYDNIAIDKLLRIKKRGGKVMPVLASDINTVKKIAKFNKNAEILAEKFWPGGLTLIMEVSDFSLSNRVIENGMIGIRIPNHEPARLIAEVFGGIIIGTSANISGKKSLSSINDIKNELSGIDLLISSEKKPCGIKSTVVNSETLEILRIGLISEEDIKYSLKI